AKKGQLQIYIVPAVSGSARKLTDLHGAVNDLHWSPDGKQIGYLFIENPPRAAGPTAAVPPETGVIGKKVFEQRLGIVDASGGHIAFIGGWMSDEGVIGGDIFTIAAAGGTPRNLTPDIKASPCWLTWQPSGRILFTEHIEGGSGIATVDPATAEVTSLWTGGE